MTPYYSDSLVTLYLGDCRDILPSLPSGCVDAAVTDPPYNVGLEYGAGTNDRRDDYREWCAAWFGELRRVTVGAVAISCGQANIATWADIEPPTWWLAWHKPAAMGRCVVGFNNWEPIALYGKPSGAVSDVIRAPIVPNGELGGHPCPKPLEWAAKQIGMLCPAGGTIMDPFVGTGTTLRAAKNMNRRAIGIEIEERFCEIAVRRLDQGVLDLGGAA